MHGGCIRAPGAGRLYAPTALLKRLGGPSTSALGRT